jgi:hypothetical protein
MVCVQCAAVLVGFSGPASLHYCAGRRVFVLALNETRRRPLAPGRDVFWCHLAVLAFSFWWSGSCS